MLRAVETGDSVVVTKDGEEIAKIIPLGRAERQWRGWVRDAGGDPDDPHWRRPADARPLPAEEGTSLSDRLDGLRRGER